MANVIGGTIVWKIDIDDSEFTSGLDKASQEAENFGNQLQEGTKRVNNLGSVFAKVTSSIGGGLKEIGELAVSKVGLIGGGGLIAFATAAAFSSSRIDELTLALHAIGKANGIVASQTDDAVTALRKNNIAYADALQITSRFIQNELKLSDAIELSNVAKDLAVIAGTGSSEATNILTEAISGQSVMMLRQFGIITTLDVAYENYGKIIGKTSDTMTEAEKKQALLNVILEAGVKVAGTYDAAMESSGKQFRSLTTRIIPDFIAQIGRAFEPALAVAVNGITESIKNMGKWLDDNKDTVAQWGKSIAGAMQTGMGMVGKLISFLVKNKEILIGAFTAIFAGVVAFGINLAVIHGAAILVFTGITTAVTLLVKAFGGWENVVTAVKNAIKGLGDIFNTFLKPSFDGLISSLKLVLPELKSLWDIVSPVLIPAFKILGAIFIGVIVVALKTMIKQLKLGLDAFNFLYQKISDFINFLTPAFKTIVSAISPALAAIADFARNWKFYLGKAVDATTDFVKNTLTQLGQWGQDAIDSINTFIKNSQDNLSIFGNNVKKALQPWRDNFLGTLGKTLTEGADKIYQWDLDRLEEYRQFGTKVGIALQSGAGSLITAIGKFFSTTLPAWGAGFITWGTSVINYFTVTLPALIGTAITNAGTAISNSIDTFFSTTLPAWGAGLGSWGTMIETYFTVTLPAQITTNVSGLSTAITNGITNIWANVQTWWANLGTQSADSISLGFLNQEPSMAGKIVGTILKVIGLVLLTLVVGFVEVGIRGSAELVISIINGIINGVPKIVDSINSLIASIKTAFDNMIAQAFDWGKNLLNSFGDGIKAATQDLIKSVSGALDSAKKLLKGNSPPVTGPFENIDIWGENVGMAWVQGIENAINSVSFDNPMQSRFSSPTAQPAFAQAQAGGKSGPLVNIEQMSVREDSDITDISRELAFRLETSSGYTNG